MKKKQWNDILWVSDNLSEKQINEITARFNQLLDREIIFEIKQDKNLLGGFLARIDDKIFDASMRGKLDSICCTTMHSHEGDQESIPLFIGNNESLEETLSLDKQAIMQNLAHIISHAPITNSIYQSGTVASSQDGVVFIEDLKGRKNGELLEFENDVLGMALELEESRIGAVLFSDIDKVRVGSKVRGTDRIVEVPVGNILLGRVLDPLGRPRDGQTLHAKEYRSIEHPAPGIMDRQIVNKPLSTGLLSIDSMIPIGRGQRELIIGDRETGKTQIAVDTILNQKESGVLCIYCAIGQKASTIAQIINTLTENDALRYSIVVAATASDSPALQYIAPYSACSMAEYFMEKGKDVLIVYDDLSKHAVAYRTMSLLLKRPPGREAYPGDVFYLHSRLLERSAHLNDHLGGGSITALPIVETQAGDISSYIPTNIISITDGQIFLESELFNAGIRPAVNVGLSVSRVGRSAQHDAMKKVSGTLRIDLARYRELVVFAQFSSDIDSTTKDQLNQGNILTQLLKQNKQSPMRLSEQVAVLLSVKESIYKDIPPHDVPAVSKQLLAYLHSVCPVELDAIDQTGKLDEHKSSLLREAIKEFTQHKDDK